MRLWNRRGALAAAVGLALAGTAAAQAPQKTAPADKVFPYLGMFLKRPAAERTAFHPVYRMTIEGKPATASQKAWYVSADGTRTPLRLAADGAVLNPPTLAQLEAKTGVAFDAPATTKFGVTMSVEPKAAPAAEIDARELALATTQATRTVKAAAGLVSFAAPKFERVLFHGAQGGRVVTPTGEKPLPVEGKTPWFAPASEPTAQRVRFDTAPQRLSLAPNPKPKKK